MQSQSFSGFYDVVLAKAKIESMKRPKHQELHRPHQIPAPGYIFDSIHRAGQKELGKMMKL